MLFSSQQKQCEYETLSLPVLLADWIDSNVPAHIIVVMGLYEPSQTGIVFYNKRNRTI